MMRPRTAALVWVVASALYDGDHTNRVVERIEQKVLPFFSKNLATRK